MTLAFLAYCYLSAGVGCMIDDGRMYLTITTLAVLAACTLLALKWACGR